MRILLLSSGTDATSTKKLLEAAEHLGHEVQLLNPLDLHMEIGEKNALKLGSKKVSKPDLVIPRFGWMTLNYGLRVLKHFEMLGVPSINSSLGIRQASDKWLSLQILKQNKLPVVNSVMAYQTQSSETTSSYYKKAVVKLTKGSQGFGIAKGDSPAETLSLVDILRTASAEHFVQEYSSISKGADLRVLVFRQQVLAGMKRTPRSGEFRSNLHRGGKASPVKLANKEEKLALAATKALQLDFAGVDLIRTKKGYAVLEVNPFPGIEGIEKVSKLDIASVVMEQI